MITRCPAVSIPLLTAHSTYCQLLLKYNQPASPHFLCRLRTLLPLSIPAYSIFIYIVVKAILPLRRLISDVIPSCVLVDVLVWRVKSAHICLKQEGSSTIIVVTYDLAVMPCDKFSSTDEGGVGGSLPEVGKMLMMQ